MIHSFISNAPPKLAGKEFEELILFRSRQMNADGLWHFGRYGVKCSRMRDKQTGELRLIEMRSLPDFEGSIAPHGRQIIVEAKVESGASYTWSAMTKNGESETKKNQIRHLIDRSEVGALCYMLIHFNERVLKTRTDEPFTVAIPITRESQFVREILTGWSATLSRSEAQLVGVPVDWNAYGERGRKQTPDLGGLLNG